MLTDVSSYLTEQPESFNQAPSSDFDNVTTERVYKLKKLYRAAVKTAIEPGDRGLDDDGYLIDYNFRSAIAYDTLTVRFSTRIPNGLFPAIRINAGTTSQYYLESTGGVLPLWQVKEIRTGSKDYLTKWNYALATRIASATTPSWWDTATDTIVPVSDSINYRWISDSSSLASGWVILEDKTKAGVDGKQVYDVAIRRERYVRTTKDISKAVLNNSYITNSTYLLSKEFELYGHTSGEWLAAPSSANPESDLIRITTMFYHAAEWDKELYGDLRTS